MAFCVITGRGETGRRIRRGTTWRLPICALVPTVTEAFSLLHGFGFASGLASMGLPPAEIPLALLLFNLGVEAAQLLFVLPIVRLAHAFRILEMRWPVSWPCVVPVRSLRSWAWCSYGDLCYEQAWASACKAQSAGGGRRSSALAVVGRGAPRHHWPFMRVS